MAIWTDERVEQLKKLVTEEQSATQIAAAFGNIFTRNAIIGKAGRLGLQLMGKHPFHKPGLSAFAPRRKPALPPPPPEVPSSKRCQLLDLRFGQCRFPYGDVVPFEFCGERTYADGASWCAEHSRIVYQRRT